MVFSPLDYEWHEWDDNEMITMVITIKFTISSYNLEDTILEAFYELSHWLLLQSYEVSIMIISNLMHENWDLKSITFQGDKFSRCQNPVLSEEINRK